MSFSLSWLDWVVCLAGLGASIFIAPAAGLAHPRQREQRRIFPGWAPPDLADYWRLVVRH